MTQLYGDYTTVYDVRTVYRGSGTSETGQDTLFLDLIRSTSRDIEAACGLRKFYPRVETRRFDVPPDRALDMDDDLLAVTTLTNGDATTIASTEYDLVPYNNTPYYQIRLKSSSGYIWQPDTSGNVERAISLLGVWGYHRDYSGAWLDTLGTLAAAITSTSATTFTCTTGKLIAGYLIKVDDEFMYVSSVSVSTSDTATVVRGVNGSTAATHLNSSVIYRWYMPEIEMICRQAVSAYERLKNNPTGDSIVMDGHTFSTPKDVHAWVIQQLQNRGYARLH